MDVVIPAHNVRTFSSSVACLAKIGKELYVAFDPLDGLTLRTLNDAKSAYGCFAFSPGFFERCAAPPPPPGSGGGSGSGGRRGRKGRSRGRDGRRTNGGGRRRAAASDDDDGPSRDGDGDRSDDSDDDDGLYTCRVPLRTVHAVLRPRKGVDSLRVRSVGAAAAASAPSPPATGSQPSRSAAAPVTPDGSGGNNNSNYSGNRNPNGDDGPRMQLSFEFQVSNPKSGGTLRTVHSVGVTDADGVAAVAPRAGRSEIVTSPGTLLRLLDPLKRTAEVALTVDDVGRTVTATSFHHGDAVAAMAGAAAAATAGGGAENAVLSAATASVLKTETSIGVDEFEEYAFRDDRNDDGDDEAEGGQGENGGGGGGGIPPPPGVNEEVTLVFGIKEARAMLQFASQAGGGGGGGASGFDHHGGGDGGGGDGAEAVVSFHWGGRPVTIEAEGGSFRSQLILATLDHRLLGRGARTRNNGGDTSGKR